MLRLAVFGKVVKQQGREAKSDPKVRRLLIRIRQL